MVADAEIERVLDDADRVVRAFASGEMTWPEFLKTYDPIYVSFPFDGHEPACSKEQLLAWESRIALHRDLWEQVITRGTSDALMHASAVAAKSFLGSVEALELVRNLLAQTRRTP